MLVDYIPIKYLPSVVVWIDWMFYAYFTSFVVIMLAMGLLQWIYYDDKRSPNDWVAALVGFSIWILYCTIKYGRAVG